MQILVYDVAHLEHPKPLEIMTSALVRAQEGDILIMAHHREPFLLYDIIKARSLGYEVLSDNGSFFIIIAAPKTLARYLQYLALDPSPPQTTIARALQDLSMSVTPILQPLPQSFIQSPAQPLAQPLPNSPTPQASVDLVESNFKDFRDLKEAVCFKVSL